MAKDILLRVVVRRFSREWQCRRQAGGVVVASLPMFTSQYLKTGISINNHSNSRAWKCSPITLHTCEVWPQAGDAQSSTLPVASMLLWPNVQGDYSIGTSTSCVLSYVSLLSLPNQQYKHRATTGSNQLSNILWMGNHDSSKISIMAINIKFNNYTLNLQ